jgi:hypothetical protein
MIVYSKKLIINIIITYLIENDPQERVIKALEDFDELLYLKKELILQVE